MKYSPRLDAQIFTEATRPREDRVDALYRIAAQMDWPMFLAMIAQHRDRPRQREGEGSPARARPYFLDQS